MKKYTFAIAALMLILSACGQSQAPAPEAPPRGRKFAPMARNNTKTRPPTMALAWGLNSAKKFT